MHAEGSDSVEQLLERGVQRGVDVEGQRVVGGRPAGELDVGALNAWGNRKRKYVLILGFLNLRWTCHVKSIDINMT